MFEPFFVSSSILSQFRLDNAIYGAVLAILSIGSNFFVRRERKRKRERERE